MINHYDILVPIYRVNARILIDKGLPWTEIEHLLLFALCQKSWDSSALAIHGGLPRTLVLEVIVRFMQRGWVSMSLTESAAMFEATNEGKTVVNYEVLPHIEKKVALNIDYIIDRVTGSVFSTKGVSILREREATELSAASNEMIGELAPTIDTTKHRQFPSLLVQLQEIAQNPDIIRPDSIFESISDERPAYRAGSYLGLSYDDEKIYGLPRVGADKLHNLIRTLINTKKISKKTVHTTRIQVDSPKDDYLSELHTIDFDFQQDLFFSYDQHKKLLKKIFATAATHIVIYSTFLKCDNAEQWLADMRDATLRGVSIDLLWDLEEGSLHEYNNFSKKIDDAGLSPWVTLHKLRMGSHAKLILFDTVEKEIQVILGSCNWLSNPFKDKGAEASIRLRTPTIVRECIAALEKLLPSRTYSKAIQSRLGGLIKRLNSEGEGLRKSTTANTIKARILFTGDHDRVIQEACRNKPNYLYVASHMAGNSMESQILEPFNSLAR
ncbi:MAG: hypothetical protein OEZ58_22860, partial [Gammaproteobacteria bacterium]|nr:hypothetical protein [Gammaproteobacteria bacterium]